MRLILDIPIPLTDVINETKGIADAVDENAYVYCVCTDSREAMSGDLFFNLANDAQLGSEHVKDAIEKNAISISVIEHKPSIAVKDTRYALLAMASLYKRRLRKLRHTVAVTGSTGKTTVTRFITRILSQSFEVGSTIGNYNNIIGLSLSVLSASRNTEILVLEMGMNHEGEISPLSKAMCPDICIITNVGTAHIGNLGSREAIARAKLEITDSGCKYLLYPKDEQLLPSDVGRLTFSLSEGADFSLVERNGSISIISDILSVDGIKLRLKGEHYRKSLIASAAASILADISASALRAAIEQIDESDCRARIYRIYNKLTVIDDSYNSSFEAAGAMLTMLSDYPPPHAAVLGDMLELGDMSNELHIALGRLTSDARLSLLVAVGEFSEQIRQGALSGPNPPERIICYDEAFCVNRVADTILQAFPRGTVLIKGSHATELYKIGAEIRRRNE